MYNSKWWLCSAYKGEMSPSDMCVASNAGPLLPCMGAQRARNLLMALCCLLTGPACVRPEEMRVVLHEGTPNPAPTTVEIYHAQGRINAILCEDERLIVHGMSGVLDLGPLDSPTELFTGDAALSQRMSSQDEVLSGAGDEDLLLRPVGWPHIGWPHDALVGEALYPSPDGLSLLTVRHTGPVILLVSAPDVEGGFVRHEIPVRGASVKYIQWESARNFTIVSYTDIIRVSVAANAVDVEGWKASPIVAGTGRDVWAVEEHAQGQYAVVRYVGDASTILHWNWERDDWGDPVVLRATVNSPYVLTSSGTILHYDGRVVALHPLLPENPSGAIVDFCVVNIDGNLSTFLLHVSNNDWRVYRQISATLP
jgi:hypothetical protein